MPLRARHFQLVLKRLIYFLGLKDTDYARTALNSSLELAAGGKKSWVADLTKAASRLPFGCPELFLTDVTSIRDVEIYATLADKLMLEWLQDTIDSSEKLYSIQGRIEPQKDKPPTQIISKMWHYLNGEDTEASRGTGLYIALYP